MKKSSGYRPGMASVENGQIRIFGPSQGEDPATITPCEGIVLKVNGSPVEEETEVTESDNIEIEPVTEEHSGEIKVTVSENKMKAHLQVFPDSKVTYTLKDQLPTRKLQLVAEKKEEVNCPFTVEDVKKEIENFKLADYNEEAVKEALDNAGYKQVDIAEGIPPSPPRDESLELKVDTDNTKKPAVKADGRVDYRESMSNIASVAPGELIAEKIPAVPGREGKDIYGNKIAPREPKKISTQVGEGAQLTENDSKVMALASGQPEIKRSENTYYIDVQPNFNHKGNVDINSGNIRFKGNVQVKGNVEQGMLVSATQNLKIDGLVNQATLTAGNEITVSGHVLASKIEAGASVTDVQNILPLLESVHKSIIELQIASKQAYTKVQDKAPIGKVVSMLIEKKFTSIPKQIKQINDIAENNAAFPPDVEQLSIDLRKKLWGVNALNLEGIEEMKELADRVSEIKLYLELLLDNTADVNLKYCLNSKIEATGSVYVTGQGCIDTTIKAGENVYIEGIYRGGNIEAGDDVVVKEAGSKVGVPTYIKVPEDKSIFLAKAFENVVLQIGEQQMRLNRNISNRIARLDVYDVVEFSDWNSNKNSG